MKDQRFYEKLEARIRQAEQEMEEIKRRYSPTWTRAVRAERGLRIVAGGKK